MQEIGPLCCFRGRGRLARSTLALPACPTASEFMGIKHQTQAFSCARSHYP
jgi:hypothetical protein